MADFVHPDLQALRVMAHPMRLRMLGLLRQYGPSTATRLGERLGINSGAASYHLRQLAAAGLIEEDAGLGTGRDRWWRATHQSTRYEPAADVDEEQQEAGATFLRAVAATYAERLARAAEEAPLLPAEWRRAAGMSDRLLLLTAEELTALNEEMAAVVERYRAHTATAQAPEGAVQVFALHGAFPVPGEAAPAGGAEER